MKTPAKIRLLVVDDHFTVRMGLTASISMEPDMEVVAEAADGGQALELFAKYQPDLVLLDLRMPGKGGTQTTIEIRHKFPGARILILSAFDGDEDIHRALRAGACGYVMKDEPSECLVDAIHRALAGETILGRRAVARVLRRLADGQSSLRTTPVELLSDRELEIFQLIGAGHPPGQIAAGLNVSVKTVESHRTHIRRKLGIKNAAELYQHAAQFVQDDATVGNAA